MIVIDVHRGAVKKEAPDGRDHSSFRSQVSGFTQGRPRSAVRYPPAFRAEVVTVVRRRMAQGGRPRDLAREIGVAPWTLALWLRQRPPRVLRAVTIAPDAEPILGMPPSAGRPMPYSQQS